VDPRRRARIGIALGIIGLLAFPAVNALILSGGVYTLLVGRLGSNTLANVTLVLFLVAPLAGLVGGVVTLRGGRGGSYFRAAGILGSLAMLIVVVSVLGSGTPSDVTLKILVASFWAPALLALGLSRKAR